MAAEQAWMCPICRDERKDVAYAVPCCHEFCLGCILRWAKQNNSCPLCRMVMTVVRVAEWDDDEDLDFVIWPPAQPVPACFQAGIAPGYSPHSSLPSPSLSPLPSPLPFLLLQEEQENEEAEEQDAQEAGEEGAEEAQEQWAEEAEEQQAKEEDEDEAEEVEELQAEEVEELQAEEAEDEPTVGGLLPEIWAALFRRHQQILDPVLPWLRQELRVIFGAQWWPALSTESIILNALCNAGLDSEALVQEVWPVVEDRAEALIQGLINTIVCQCSEEALRQLGLQDADMSREQQDSPVAAPSPVASPRATLTSRPASPNTQDRPSTPEAVLHGCPVVHILREPEEPHEEVEQGTAAGPSAEGSSSSAPGRSPGGARHPRKRRADSDCDPDQPCKRLRRRRH
ncbi:E3 ubiquitin-protein ligase Topors-like [Phasianus colchicus]|uniref:E3 ubiquitin-protein ligase Topors-like n=1 Tax=Phasianus colchicus TaxID=9054 RepID=UPI00129D7619|nr:E3 ubiquitin-protein ligase Topors-like [Phasianus colchicus]